MENLGQYFSFKGKATRSEYWAMIGITFIAMVMMFAMLGAADQNPILLLAVIAMGIGAFVYNIATTVRRIRDTGQNVLWIIAVFLPYVAPITIIVFGCLPTEEE